MNLSAPSKLAFYISLVLFIVALLAHFTGIIPDSIPAIYAMLAAWVVLAAGNVLTGF